MSRLEKFISTFLRVFKPVSNVFTSIGLVTLAAMMFLTAADVFLRYSINKPILGSYEITQFLMAITVSLGLSYTAIEKSHINIDALVIKLSKKIQGYLSCVTGAISLIVTALLVWQTYVQMMSVKGSELTSSVLQIPAFPFVIIAVIGTVLLWIVFLIHLLEFILQVRAE